MSRLAQTAKPTFSAPLFSLGVRRFAAEAAPEGPAEYISLSFVDRDGTSYHVPKALVGSSLYDVALENKIDKIPLKYACGGGVHEDEYGYGPECEFCHVLIPKEYQQYCEPMRIHEKQIIEDSYFTNSNSRLGCEVILRKEMDGMKVGIPIYQRYFTEEADSRML